MVSSRLFTTIAPLPAVLFNLVKPNTTQNPMKSASTNTVLDARPCRTPRMRDCRSPALMLLLPATVTDLARRSKQVLAELPPSPTARPCAASGFHLHQDGDARRAAIAWPSRLRRRQTG